MLASAILLSGLAGLAGLAASNCTSSASLTCTAVAPNGHVVAAGSSDGTLYLVDARTCATVATFRAGSGSVARLDWDERGARLGGAVFATSAGAPPADAEHESIDSVARWIVWEVATSSIQLDETSLESGLHDPTLRISGDGKRMITLGCAAPADLWDLDRGIHVARLDRGVRIRAAAWSSDGAQVFTGDDAGQVCAWSAVDGRLVRVRSASAGPITALATAPDGTLILVASALPATLTALATRDFQSLWKREFVIGPDIEDHIVALSFDRDSSHVVAGTGATGMIESWSVRGGAHSTLLAPDFFRETHLVPVFDPAGERVAVAGEGTPPHVIDASGGSDLDRLGALHVRGGLGSFSWTADCRYLVARCSELVVLDGVKYEPIGTWSPLP